MLNQTHFAGDFLDTSSFTGCSPFANRHLGAEPARVSPIQVNSFLCQDHSWLKHPKSTQWTKPSNQSNDHN